MSGQGTAGKKTLSVLERFKQKVQSMVRPRRRPRCPTARRSVRHKTDI
jgi:hypothetical protein